MNQRLQHGAVQAVQAARIHLVHVQRGCGIGRVNAVHAVHQRPVTHTTQQTVRNTRRAAGTTGNLGETLGGNLHVHQTRATAQHQLKLLHRVELQVTGKTEAVTQRTGQQTRTGRRTHQGELRQLQRNGSRTRTLTDHNVHTEIFHRHVEHFLSRAAHTVNLIQEQHLTGSQRRQNRRQITRMLNRRAGGNAQRCLHLCRNNHRESGLTQTGRARQQHMVGATATHLRSLQHQRQLLTHTALTHKVIQGLRAQCRLNHLLFRLFFHRHQALGGS